MNLRHVRTFVTIADLGGVARAAARLHMSQPTASRQVSALESELGVTLFEHVGRNVKLTSDGEDLLARSRVLLADVNSIAERARALKAGNTGTLRIATTPQAMESLLAQFLPLYRARHPGVETRLIEDGGTRLPTRLERGDANLAIMPEGNGRFGSCPLHPVHLLAVVPRSHKLAKRAIADVTELAEEPLLLLARSFASREWFETACEVARIRTRPVLESSAPQTLIALAAAGHGVAVVPSSVVIRFSRVQALPVVHARTSIGRWTTIAWDPQRVLAPYAESFVKELAAYTQRDYPNRQVTRRAPTLARPKATPT